MAGPTDLLSLISEFFRPLPTPPPVPVSPTPDPAFAEQERAYREELARRDANAAGLMFGLGPNLLQAANSADPQEVFLNQFDPSLTYTDVYSRGGEPSTVDKVMGFGAGLAEPGPGEVGMLDEVLPLLGMFAMPRGLQRYWREAGGEIQDRLFHGTQRTFDNPDERFFRDGNFGTGYYLTRDPARASDYGLSGEVVGIDDAARPQVRAEFGRFQRPFDTDAPLTEQDYDDLLGTLSWANPEAGERLASRIHVGQSRYDTYRDLQEVLGYNGNITNMVLDASGFDGVIADAGREVVAFSPNQVFGGPDGPERLIRQAQVEGFRFTPDELEDLRRQGLLDTVLELMGR